MLTARVNQYIEIRARWRRGEDSIGLVSGPGEAIIRIKSAASTTGYRAQGGGGMAGPGAMFNLGLPGPGGTVDIIAAFTRPGVYVLRIGSETVKIHVIPAEKRARPRLKWVWAYPSNTGLVVITQYNIAVPGIPTHITVHVRDHDTGAAKTIHVTTRTRRGGTAVTRIPAAQLAPSPHQGANHLEVQVLVNGKPAWRGHETVWLNTMAQPRRRQAKHPTTRQPRPPSPPRTIPRTRITRTIRIPQNKTTQPTILIKR